MSATFFSKGKEHILNGDIDLLNGNIIVLLLSAEYVSDFLVDESLQAIPDSAIVAEETLNGNSISNGVFDADDVLFSDVAGDRITTIVLAYEDEDRVKSKSWLICMFGNQSITPDGSAITIQWDNGTSKIFALQ